MNQYLLDIEFHYELSRAPALTPHPAFGPVDNARREIETAFVEAGYTISATPERQESDGEHAPVLEVWRDDERIHATVCTPVPGQTLEDAQACIGHVLKGLVAEGSLRCTEAAGRIPLRKFTVAVSGSVEVWAVDENHADTLGRDSIRQKSAYSDDQGMDFTDILTWPKHAPEAAAKLEEEPAP